MKLPQVKKFLKKKKIKETQTHLHLILISQISKRLRLSKKRKNYKKGYLRGKQCAEILQCNKIQNGLYL